MSKKKEQEEVLAGDLWVHVGRHETVIVTAKNKRHAMDKVKKSPKYDGTPPFVEPMEKFLSKCSPKEEVPVPAMTPAEQKVDDSKVYISIKALAGKVSEVKIYSDGEAAKTDADKFAGHLDMKVDDMQIFILDNHQEIGLKEFIEAKPFHIGSKPKAVAPTPVQPISASGTVTIQGAPMTTLNAQVT